MWLIAQATSDAARETGAVSTVLFYIFALMAAGSAVAVVASRNIVRMAVYLLFTPPGSRWFRELA